MCINIFLKKTEASYIQKCLVMDQDVRGENQNKENAI